MEALNIHNMSQSTVAGPYLQPSGYKAPVSALSGAGSVRGGPEASGYHPQPIVQLTVPGDRTQVTTSSRGGRSMREEYLIQGMPTALINNGAQMQPTMSE